MKSTNIYKILENEIEDYIEGSIELSPGYRFSQYKLVKRIVLYANGIYPKGKLDSQGNYKYWFDICAPRIDSEIKNIDFDTKDIKIYSESEKDNVSVLVTNAAVSEWLNETGQASLINEAIEQGSGWGNVVWKKVKGGYEIVDLKNFYVVNQVAECLNDTPTIERAIMTQADLRAKRGIWNDNIDEVIKNCGDKSFTVGEQGVVQSRETPYYEIYERNGEISQEALYEAQGKNGGDPDKYVLAKIIVAGLNKTTKDGKTQGKYVLFAEEMKEMPYKEYHRGRYNGRWFRPGIYEILMDIQTRSNEIGNQIARGLEWSSKTIFNTADRTIAQNVLTDLANGDIVRTQLADLRQVDVRMQGLDQLIADWNRLMVMADKLCNSYEVVQGENMPSGTPFRTTNLLNQNANKLFDFIREKLGIALGNVIQDWILPNLMRDIKDKDIIRMTGDADMVKRFNQILVDGWYIANLLSFQPHNEEQAMALKQTKLDNLKKSPKEKVKLVKGWWEGFKPRTRVVITGENVNLAQELETFGSFIGLEQDPVRRTALIEKAMMKKGIDVATLPKTEQQPTQQPGAIPMDRAKRLKQLMSEAYG